MATMAQPSYLVVDTIKVFDMYDYIITNNYDIISELCVYSLCQCSLSLFEVKSSTCKSSHISLVASDSGWGKSMQ